MTTPGGALLAVIHAHHGVLLHDVGGGTVLLADGEQGEVTAITTADVASVHENPDARHPVVAHRYIVSGQYVLHHLAGVLAAMTGQGTTITTLPRSPVSWTATRPADPAEDRAGTRWLADRMLLCPDAVWSLIDRINHADPIGMALL